MAGKRPAALRRAVLQGFGSVGQHVAQLLLREHPCQLVVVGICDSGGGASSDGGFDLAAVLAHKQAGHSVRTCPGATPHADGRALCEAVEFDVLLEASPANLADGGVGLAGIRSALGAGRRVVTANKAPLVLAFAELAALGRGRLAFSACVCGGLPVVNVGVRDCVGATFTAVEGVFNSTSNYVLTAMERGASREAALAEAQRRGIAEADPTLDVEGFDSACKLVIVANAVLGVPAELHHVQRRGIMDVNAEQVQAARDAGQALRLVARARRDAGTPLGYALSVAPERVPAASAVGGCCDTDMCVVFDTDIYERVTLKTNETGVFPTAAAMLRDVLHLQ